MKLKYMVVSSFMLFGFASAQAGEYVCKVYCSNGTTATVVQASSSGEAAKKIDPTPVANSICQAAGKGNASSSTMGSSQCSAK